MLEISEISKCVWEAYINFENCKQKAEKSRYACQSHIGFSNMDGTNGQMYTVSEVQALKKSKMELGHPVLIKLHR